eukprot:6189213-Pleurochrysis_carterae.AAC.1
MRALVASLSRASAVYAKCASHAFADSLERSFDTCSMYLADISRAVYACASRPCAHATPRDPPAQVSLGYQARGAGWQVLFQPERGAPGKHAACTSNMASMHEKRCRWWLASLLARQVWQACMGSVVPEHRDWQLGTGSVRAKPASSQECSRCRLRSMNDEARGRYSVVLGTMSIGGRSLPRLSCT